MFSLELESDGEAKDILIAELWDSGSTGIVETDLPDGRCLLSAFFDDEAGADSLLRRFSARLKRHAPRDWVAFSRSGWEPLCAGERFYLVPAWRDDPAPPGRYPHPNQPRAGLWNGLSRSFTVMFGSTRAISASPHDCTRRRRGIGNPIHCGGSAGRPASGRM